MRARLCLLQCMRAGDAAIESLLADHAGKVNVRGIVRKAPSGDRYQGTPVEVCVCVLVLNSSVNSISIVADRCW